MRLASYEDFANWEKENFREALAALLKNCERFNRISVDKALFPQVNSKITRANFYSICRIAEVIKNYDNRLLQIFFEKYFVPYRVLGKNDGKSLFTGYYIPHIRAKVRPDKIFKYPIHRRPPDLIDGKKYYTRREICAGAIRGRNLELIYGDDPVEIFYMQIQGSGIVYLVDERRTIYLGFDGKNNHNYFSIEKYMIQQKLAPKNTNINPKVAKLILKKNPNRANTILNMNDSYVFFREVRDGKIRGAFGTELIPKRTMAVDNRYIPLGFPLWVETNHTGEHGDKKFDRILIANDTGAAIKGAVRGDIFFGFGREAEDEASFQYASGRYFLLIPIKIAKKLR